MMKNWLRLLLPMIMSLSAQVSGQSLFFSNLTTRDGLPSNIISAVAQDNYDFIWIGTGNGLARYDGYTTRTFKREEHAASLPANEISALLVVGDTLWVGTWRGLCTIHTRNFTIRRVDLQGNNTVRTLYKDRHNNVWIGTATGLIRRQPTGRTTVYTHESHQLSHNTIRSIYVDEQDNLWVGTYDRLNWLDPKKVLFESFDLKEAYKPALKNNLIGDIKPVVGHDSLLWVGTETGLCRFNRRTHRYTTYRTADGLSNEVIKYIYTDPEGRVWLGTDFGLNLLDPRTGKTETYFHNPQVNYSIANNVIWQVMEDQGGVIWIVTANGLSKVNRHNNIFAYHEVTHQLQGQTSGNQVKAMLTGRDGTLWIGTLHGVIAQQPDGSRQLFDTRAPLPYRLLLDNIFAFEEDNQGRIWIGTAGGINVWDQRQRRMYAITAQPDNGLTSNYIARFIKGSDGSFWVSAWEGGLFKVVSGFETLQQVHFEYVGDFASEKITYARQALWGLRNNELFRIHLDSFVNQKIASFNELARGRDIHNIYYAPQGNLWAGTANGLIEYQLDTDSAFFHPVVTGKPIDLTTLVSDADGYIWAAADQLVLKFDPKQHRFERFPLDHELPLKTFYSDSRTLSASGDILLGGDNGYIQFNPHITPITYAPQVRLTSLQVNNKPVTTTQPLPGGEDDRDHNDIAFVPELVLDYDQRSVTIGFSALHYWQPETNVYAYKLEGLDRDWQYVSGSKNFAVYSNLPAGDYTLVVRGTNNYGLWSPHTASLHLVVRPPLFLSKGFIALYILLVVGALVVAMRVYAVRLRLQNQLNIAVLEKEHAEKITQTKQQFFTSISHELRTPISLIIPPIQQALKRNHLDPEDRTLLSLAEKNSQRLLRLINQILDFRKLEHKNQSLTITWFDLVPFCQELYTLFADKAARQEIDFSFHSYVKSCTLWADQEKVEIILFNLISNAFKFTPRKGKIAVVLDIDTQQTPSGMALIRVSDTGVGIAIDEQRKVFEQFYQTQEARRHEDGSGIGLTLVAEYSRLHQGKVELSSTPGVGSTFSVYLPLGSDHWPVKPTDPADAVNMTVSNDSQPQISIKSDKPLVLLAEDNHDMIDFITVTLKDKYNFVVAEQGEEALDKARQYLPEVIVTDIMMPIMDGMALCRAVKQDPRTSHIPLILLTAKSLTTHKIEGIRSGADAYITKPFDIELLTAHIDHLRERKAELALYFRHELITAPQGDESKANNEDDKFLKKVMNTIEAHLADPDFGVEVLSEEVGMSATHLYRKLKSLTKLSANEIIRKYRLKKASFLLKNKEGNISEIMYAVGFSNLSYFSKCFKQEFGLNPKEYQQQENPEHL